MRGTCGSSGANVPIGRKDERVTMMRKERKGKKVKKRSMRPWRKR